MKLWDNDDWSQCNSMTTVCMYLCQDSTKGAAAGGAAVSYACQCPPVSDTHPVSFVVIIIASFDTGLALHCMLQNL